jgi:predicted phage terminase large subunit-like protein
VAGVVLLLAGAVGIEVTATTSVSPATADKIRLAKLLREKERRLNLAADAKRMEDDLADFFKGAWSVLEPGRPLTWSWHYELFAEYLKLVRDHKFHSIFPGIGAVLVNVPPRSAKSSFFSVCFPVWMWISDPTARFLCASYSDGLSLELSIKRRDLIKSNWFQDRWGKQFVFKGDENRIEKFSNNKTGCMIATTLGGTATGQGGDHLILDDPINPKQAVSDAERKTANDTIDNTFRSRLNNPSSGIIFVIMQRLHELDPTGYLLSSDGAHCLHISIPLEAEERTEYVFPISGRVHVREQGDVLQPERFPTTQVDRLKGSRLVWAGQYQQRPSPLEGNMIKRADVQYYGGMDHNGVPDPPLPDKFDMIVISADCAFKDLKTSDFVAVSTIGVKGRKRYVLDMVNRHLDADATEMEIRRQKDERQVSAILVEDKANGSAVIKRLKTNLSGVVAIEPEGGKVARMFACAPEWQAGDWYVSRNAAWSEPLIAQLTGFPNAAHDDMADSITQASIWLQGGSNSMMRVYADEAAALPVKSDPQAELLKTAQGYDILAMFR